MLFKHNQKRIARLIPYYRHAIVTTVAEDACWLRTVRFVGSEDDITRFGRIVSQRRRELNYSMVAFREAGGPVPATTSKIERGLEPHPALQTFQRLDKALQWSPGSAARTWNGGTPVTVESADSGSTQYVATTSVGQGPAELVVSAELLPLMTRIANKIRDVRRENPDLPDSLNDPLDELDAVVDRLNRSWLVSYVEQRLLNDGSIAEDPLLTVILGPQLDARQSSLKTDYDRADAAYLRWLIGRTETLTKDQAEKAAGRWALRKESN